MVKRLSEQDKQAVVDSMVGAAIEDLKAGYKPVLADKVKRALRYRRPDCLTAGDEIDLSRAQFEELINRAKDSVKCDVELMMRQGWKFVPVTND